MAVTSSLPLQAVQLGLTLVLAFVALSVGVRAWHVWRTALRLVRSGACARWLRRAPRDPWRTLVSLKALIRGPQRARDRPG